MSRWFCHWLHDAVCRPEIISQKLADRIKKNMRVHYIQHVPFEGLSSMESCLKGRGHTLSVTHLYKNQALPPLDDIDWLIVMGGPMGISDEAVYPWLHDEKEFIKAAIHQDKIVLGICLGAQLIADAMGAKVYKNNYREIGWFDIRRSEKADNTILSSVLPEKIKVFHWHGDMFDIPDGATPLAESEACKHQAFIMGERVLALQFHLETTLASASALIDNCGNELDGSRYVHSAEEILGDPQMFSDINGLMFSILEVLEETR